VAGQLEPIASLQSEWFHRSTLNVSALRSAMIPDVPLAAVEQKRTSDA
jgi:hypothetical protein